MQSQLSKITGWAVLTISSRGLDTDQITAILGINPDRIIPDDSKGFTVWQLNSHPGGNESLAAHVEDLLTKLRPVRRKLRRLSQKHRIRFACVMETGDIPHGTMRLPARYLLLAGYLGAEIELSFQASGLVS